MSSSPSQRCCIACLTNNKNLTSLFSLDVDTDSVQIRVKLTTCFPDISWPDEDFVNFICRNCLTTLRVTFSFREMCLRSCESFVKPIKRPQPLENEQQIIEISDETEEDRIDEDYVEFNEDFENSFEVEPDPPKQEKPAPTKEPETPFLIMPLTTQNQDGTETIEEVIVQVSDRLCEYCSEAFDSKTDLELHLKLVHSKGEMLYDCAFCDERLILPDYWPHMKTHTDSNQINITSRVRGRRCCVPNCEDRESIKHRFPKPDRSVFQAWLDAVKPEGHETLTNDQIYSRLRVCESHFTPDCFIKRGSRGLKRDSVPTIGLPC